MRHAKPEPFVAYPPRPRWPDPGHPEQRSKDRRRAKHWRPLDILVVFLAMSGVLFWGIVLLILVLAGIGLAVSP